MDETLAIEQGERGLGTDHWTWLDPDEARAIADALTDAADEADTLRSRDPRGS